MSILLGSSMPATNALGHYPMSACEWRVGPPDDFRNGWREIRIVERTQRDLSCLYAVVMRSYTANRDGEWEHEPIPSSRDDDYMARCRFADWEEAALLAQKMVRKEVYS